MGETFTWKQRHTVLSILLAGWLVSYMDQRAVSVAMPYVASDFHLRPLAMGAVISVFYASYAISQIPGGILVDMFGPRAVAAIAILCWSASIALTGGVGTVNQMMIACTAFGLAAGAFPACTFKTIAVWFPNHERATAIALIFAFSLLGAGLAPLAVVAILSFWSWRTVFYSLFIPGALISSLFWFVVREKSSESGNNLASERNAAPQSIAAESQIRPADASILQVITDMNVLQYALVVFTCDSAYWGLMMWLPTYLIRARGFSLTQMGVAAALPFFAGAIGAVLGGWLSDRHFRSNRKAPIVVSQLTLAAMLYLTFIAVSPKMLVTCQAVAGFFYSTIMTTFWALPMNTIPASRMGVAGSFINMASAVAGFTSPVVIGYLVGIRDGNFDFAFLFLIGSLLVSCALIFTIPAVKPGRVMPSSTFL